MKVVLKDFSVFHIKNKNKGLQMYRDVFRSVDFSITIILGCSDLHPVNIVSDKSE